MLGLLEKIFLGVLTFTIVACGNFEDTKSSPRPPQALETFTYDFQTVKKEILEPYNCIECHKQYKEYANAKQRAQGILSSVLEGRMPKRGPQVSSEHKEILKTWVAEGAPEFINSNPDDLVEKPLEPTWSSIFTNIISVKCLDCHGGDRKVAGLDFGTFESFAASDDELIFAPTKFLDTEDPENSYLISVVSDPEFPMPPKRSNYEQVTEDQIKILVEWIKRGLPL